MKTTSHQRREVWNYLFLQEGSIDQPRCIGMMTCRKLSSPTGLSTPGASKWFHQWSELNVRYVDGGMEYTICDPSFPGVTVSLTALPLADSPRPFFSRTR